MPPGLLAATRAVAGQSQGRWLLRVSVQQWKAFGVKDKSKCIQTPAIQFTSCAASIKSANLSEPPLTHFHNGMQA